MRILSLIGIDDRALRSAVAEIVQETDGVALVPTDPHASVDVVLVLMELDDNFDERLGPLRRHYPAAELLVLVPFSQPALLLRALAYGAVACHALDQPTNQLRAMLEALARSGPEKTVARMR